MNISFPLRPTIYRIHIQRGQVFGFIIISALLAFEVFNYSTTEFALTDLLGDLRFTGIRWATILAIAFCGIDFAGLARLLTPGDMSTEQNEIWYLFGAWLLAATMNAILTWWGVSIAILHHKALDNSIMTREMMLSVVPIFVAIMVWLIRVLIIGSFSSAGKRLFTQAERHPITQATNSYPNGKITMQTSPVSIKKIVQTTPIANRAIPSHPKLKIVQRPEPMYTPFNDEPIHKDNAGLGPFPDIPAAIGTNTPNNLR